MTIITILLLLLSFELGVFVGARMNSPYVASNKQTVAAGGNTFQAGWDAAKKRLIEFGFGGMTGNKTEIKTMSGKITAASEGKLTVKINPITPLDDPALDNRTVLYDSNTKIYQLTQKDFSVYQKELNTFVKNTQKRLKSGATSSPSVINAPEMFDKAEVQLSDLKIGQQIMITASSSIADIKEIKAVEISIQNIPAGLSAMSQDAPAAPTTPKQ